MTQELLLHLITAIYAICNVVRLLFYVPQLLAVVRDPLGACAISLSTWTFWTFSHAVTTVYCGMVVCDPFARCNDAWQYGGVLRNRGAHGSQAVRL